MDLGTNRCQSAAVRSRDHHSQNASAAVTASAAPSVCQGLNPNLLLFPSLSVVHLEVENETKLLGKVFALEKRDLKKILF